MSTYTPETKVFYGKIDSAYRLIPSPNITISLEFNYSNDTIIGYTYIVNLSGSITALDLRDLNYGANIPSSPDYNTGAVIDHIHKLRNILTQNGNILHIVNGIDNSHIFRAKGGILRSFTIDESANNWTSFASYSASLEFHSIDFLSATEDCSGIFLDPSTFNTDGIVDITQFKIKSFQDSWSFSFNEEAFNKIKSIDNNINLNINNHSFNIQYSISATGKHFFVYDDEMQGTSKLLPAWEQAKNFVQDRLYNQVTNLITNILKDQYSNACTSSDGLDDILEPASGEGLLKGLGDNKYKIFNELITCEASETDGTFSATYTATVKTVLGNSSWSSIDTKHTITKSINSTTNNTGSTNTNISINGTIEGLIEGGLVRINEPLNLPTNGSFIILNNQSSNKYTNAKNLLDKIYSDNDYNAGIGENGKRDLKPSFKQALGITLQALNASAGQNDTIADPPHPISFNLTHDYNAGTINYSIEYSQNRTCGRKFNTINIQTSNPNKVIAVFNIPNSNNCPLIQELGTYTAKTVNLTVEGIDSSETGQPTNLNLVNEIMGVLNLGCYDNGYLPVTLPPDGTYIITQKQYTKNPIDGSFSVNMSYICGTEGCPIS